MEECGTDTEKDAAVRARQRREGVIGSMSKELRDFTIPRHSASKGVQKTVNIEKDILKINTDHDAHSPIYAISLKK